MYFFLFIHEIWYLQITNLHMHHTTTKYKLRRLKVIWDHLHYVCLCFQIKDVPDGRQNRKTKGK